MTNAASFIVNSLLLAALIFGASYLQKKHDTQDTSIQATTESVETARTEVTASPPADTEAAAAPIPAPTVSPKPAVRGASGDDEEYDD